VLQQRGLAGKVVVSGQDAELDAVRRIVAGTQAMTVYKPLSALTRLAATWAVRLANGEKPDAAATMNNGRKDVPMMVVEPIAIDKSNIETILIGDGFHTRDAVYGAAGTQ
jgi:D-xylose transport system substrate-binding protein